LKFDIPPKTSLKKATWQATKNMLFPMIYYFRAKYKNDPNVYIADFSLFFDTTEKPGQWGHFLAADSQGDATPFSKLKLDFSLSRQFVVIKLGLYDKTGAHSNMLIFDKVRNTMERFEPHGGQSQESFQPTLLDQMLHRKFPTFDFLRPAEYCPISLQALENREPGNTLPGEHGYCLAWCWLYIDLRLQNPSFERTEIIAQVRTHVPSLRDFIRDYAYFLDSVLATGRYIAPAQSSAAKPQKKTWACEASTKTGTLCPVRSCAQYCDRSAPIWLPSVYQNIIDGYGQVRGEIRDSVGVRNIDVKAVGIIMEVNSRLGARTYRTPHALGVLLTGLNTRGKYLNATTLGGTYFLKFQSWTGTDVEEVLENMVESFQSDELDCRFGIIFQSSSEINFEPDSTNLGTLVETIDLPCGPLKISARGTLSKTNSTTSSVSHHIVRKQPFCFIGWRN